MGTTKAAMDIDYESIFCSDVNNYTIVQMLTKLQVWTKDFEINDMVSMYLLVLFLIFLFHLSFNLAVSRLHNWSAHHKELQQQLTLSSLAIKLAKWIWRKVHHRQQYLIFLPLFSVLEHHCFILFFFFLLGFQF